MREILFKAKRIDNGEWVEGNLVLSKDAEKGWEAIIIPKLDSNMFTKGGAKGNLGFENWHRVDKNTICQYTGLTDKNGNKIWENDVVKFEDCEMSTESGYGDCFVNVGKIAYDADTMSYFITDRITVDMEDMDIKNEVEVIGNTFDNTELLKGV